MDGVAAARMGDQIAHGFGLMAMIGGAILGAVVGAAIVAATAATGGMAAVIIAGSVAAGGLSVAGIVSGIQTIFELPDPPSGVIAMGSPNVLTNTRPAVRANLDFAAPCSGSPMNHFPMPGPVPVFQGSKTVLINTQPASRLKMKLMCGAHIKQGSEDVLIGGETVTTGFIWDLESWTRDGLTILGLGAFLGAGAFAVAAGAAATGIFAGVSLLGAGLFEGLGMIGDAIGPGYRDLFQGVAGVALLAAGPRMARSTPAGQTQAAVRKMPQSFQDEYAAARAAGWKKPDGSTWWPPNNGGVGTPKTGPLTPGTKLDRYGHTGGQFMGSAGDGIPQRALASPPTGTANKYTSQPGLHVEQSPVAPWFGQPGGGTQYRVVDPTGVNPKYSVQNALDDGFLKIGH
ncbi:MAG: glycohydrolase toxin TNT-related protein [Pseudomonadota bacterium]